MLNRRGFLKGLAVVGLAGYYAPSKIFDIFKRDYVSELRSKLKPVQRYCDVEMMNRGYKNIIFKSYPVTNEIVSGSIWVIDPNSTELAKKRKRKCMNDLIKFLDS